MRALVSGATGFLGSHLVRHLLASGDEATVLLRPESDVRRIRDVIDGVTVLRGLSGEWASLIASSAPAAHDTAFHLAWSGVHTTAARCDAQQLPINLRQSLNFVEAAIAARCRSVVGLGSQAEYGAYEGVLDELTPCSPSTAYGVAKLLVGGVLTRGAALYGIRGVWLRLLSAYGPDDQRDYVIPYVIRELLSGRAPQLTSGDQPHDTLFCDDVTAALRLAADSPDCSGVYVLASGNRQSVRDVAGAICASIGPDAVVGFGDAADHPGWIGSHERLTRHTGWTPSVSLRDGIERTVGWAREHAEVGAPC